MESFRESQRKVIKFTMDIRNDNSNFQEHLIVVFLNVEWS